MSGAKKPDEVPEYTAAEQQVLLRLAGDALSGALAGQNYGHFGKAYGLMNKAESMLDEFKERGYSVEEK